MNSSLSKIYEIGIPHNKFQITLPDGTTYPDFISAPDARPLEFLRHFDRVRSKPWEDCSFLDMGCSEGSTTLGLSQMGSSVHGVEGRADGIDRANVLKEILGFDNTHFRVDNVNNETAYREVDGIFNAGVLYHLEDPVTMMERCCRYARSFVYVDTGHKPKDAAELANSKFLRNFGEEFTIDYDGLELDVVNFAEPGDTREKVNGIRRGPRSGIGNSNSVWLSHASLIDLMAKLGFPYHDTLYHSGRIPRLRTCFFREKPRDPQGLDLTRPLPAPLPKEEARQVVMARDIAYLTGASEPINVIGHEPVLSQTVEYLKSHGIEPDFVGAAPGQLGDRINLAQARTLLEDKTGIVVMAARDPMHDIQALVRLDRFKNAITSIGIHFAAQAE